MKSWPIRFSILSGGLILFAVTLFFLKQPAGLETYQHLIGLPAPPEINATNSSKFKVTFLGVTSLLFDDGETAWMTDGFFSRPSFSQVAFGQLSSNDAVVSDVLQRAHVRSLAAVIPIHSHYDHALDSAMVAQKTQAILIGSSSTANIGRGAGLPENKIQTIKAGDTIQLGKFKITFIESVHSPGGFFEGTINTPLTSPASLRSYQMGDCYSLLVEHEEHSVLVHGSAGYIPDKLRSSRAEAVFLGIGTLGNLSPEFRENYWNQVVKAVGARRVILVHWDNFFKPLTDPLSPLPWPADHFQDSMDFLIHKAQSENVDLRLPLLWQVSDPLAGLKPLR